MSIFNWSSTANDNGTVDGVSIAEGMAPSNVNNAMRAIMAVIRGSFASALQTFLAGSAALPIANGGTAATTASAARTNLGLGTAATQNAGTASGVATLNSSGKVTGAQLIDYTSEAGDFTLSSTRRHTQWTHYTGGGHTCTVGNMVEGQEFFIDTLTATGNLTIAAGSGKTIYNAKTGATGSITVPPKAVAAVRMRTSSDAVVVSSQ